MGEQMYPERRRMPDNARAPWISIVLAGLLTFVVSMAVIAATVAGYAFAIAIKANPPDPHKISVFASRVPPMLGPFVLTLLVLVAARWVVRRARSTRLFHGVLVGVVATLPTLLFMRRFSLGEVVSLLLPLLGGLVGALWGRAR